MWNIENGWGDYKQDFRIGQVASIQAEINRDKQKRPQPYEPEDFALRPKSREEIEYEEERKQKKIIAAFEGLANG